MLITAIKQKLQDEFVANAAASHPVSNVNIYFLWNIDLFLWNIDLFLWNIDLLEKRRIAEEKRPISRGLSRRGGGSGGDEFVGSY